VKLELLLLGVLGRRPSTGYELKKYFDTRGRSLRANTQMSQVYRALNKMTEEGWVRFEVDPRPGPQDAKTYYVTPEGMTVLQDWLSSPYNPPEWFTEREFVARLSFAGFMTEEQVVRLIDTEVAARRAQVARDRGRDRTLAPELPSSTPFPFDAELGGAIDQRLFQWGSAGIIKYVERLEELRADIVSGRLRAEAVESGRAAASSRSS
jgi:PadR family transcriptional regulator, regulatory protein AphA